MSPGPSITPARSGADIEAAADLFKAYAASLPTDLAYQNFAAELAGLPGRYAPPGGELLLARLQSGEPVGCVALRPIEQSGCCEMKRLYVAPAGRGIGLGSALIEAILAAAKAIGYREMRLDTLPTMTDALRVYLRRGFNIIPPYYDTPIAGTIFLSRRLAD